MGPKMAINLLSIGIGAALLLTFEAVMSGAVAGTMPFIFIAVAAAVVGGVRILQIKAQQKL